MSKKDKLIAKLKRLPKDYSFAEAESLLGYLGYIKSTKGKTSGSRVMFISHNNASFTMHKPHPQRELKAYQVKQLLEFLEKEGLL